MSLLKKNIILFFFLSLSINLLAKNADSYLREITLAEEAQDLQLTLQLYSEYLEVYDVAGGNKDDKNNIIYNYATLLTYAGEHEKAINLLLPIFNVIKDDPKEQQLAAQYAMQLGIINFFIEQYDNALIYYEFAESKAKDLGIDEGVSIARNNIGNIYQKQSQYIEAIDSYFECLELQKNIKDSAVICNTIFNIGTCYEELEKHKEALTYFTDARDIALSINDKEISALTAIHIGIINNNPTYIEEGIAVVIESGHREVLLEAYTQLAHILAQNQNYEKAFYNLKNAFALKDSIHTIESARTLNEFTAKYENSKLKNEKKIQRLFFIFIAITFVIIIASLIYALRSRRLTNQKLKEINNTKDKFFSTISHELKNPLVGQKKILEILNNNFDSFSTNEIKQLNDELLRSTKSVLQLLYDLLEWAKIERKLIPYQPAPINLNSIFTGILDELNLLLKQKNITVNINTNSNHTIWADPLMFSIIIRNIIDNAIKYSHSDGNIDITAELYDTNTQITIQDFGVGMSKENIKNLFDLNAARSKKGTNGEQGGGLGFIIAKELATIHGGDIKVTSQELKGTTVVLTINNTI